MLMLQRVTASDLGLVHRELGYLKQAIDYKDRALAIKLKKFGPDHFHIAAAYNDHEKKIELEPINNCQNVT